MVYIIFDLESMVVRSEKKIGHIVEIGATKVRDEEGSLRIASTFQTYVKPPKNQEVSYGTLLFIGAVIEDFVDAPMLQQAVGMFQEWIGEEEYYLCSWSSSDLKILTENWLVNKFDTSWIKNFNDIQPPICKSINPDKQCAVLEDVVELKLGKQKDEKFHSGLYDAYITSLLFIDSYKDLKEELKINNNVFEEHLNITMKNQQKNRKKQARRTMNNGSLNSFSTQLTQKQKEEIIRNFIK